MSSDDHTCGVVRSEAVEYIEVGFPLCQDPKVLCSDDNCWFADTRRVKNNQAGSSATVKLAAMEE